MADEAKRDLAEAMPAFEAAVKALNSLNKTDISEIKTFANPPELVQIVMESVCILLQAPDTKWATAKALLGDPKFLTRLINFDKDHIPESVLKKLKKYTDNPLFNPNAVSKHSYAATSICMWVRAIERYNIIYKGVEPKRQRVNEAQALLDDSKAKLLEKQQKLAEVEDKLAELKKAYDGSEQEKTRLQLVIQDIKKKLDRAEKITSGLVDEQVRWANTLAQLDKKKPDIVGNTFISAGCVAYLGAFNRSYRVELVNMWLASSKKRGVNISEDFSVVNFLSDQVQVRDWNIWGLPSDPQSVENAIFATNGRRWPLIIDPQGQANNWIKKMEIKNGLKVLKQTDPNFMRTLENCIRVGCPVLLEDVGEVIDPALEPLLLKQVFKQSGRYIIRLGGTDIDYDKNFKFYMTSKLSNPHYLPEVCIKVTIINFTVTVKGLEDQLLGEVVAKEKPEVEEKRTDLISRIAADKKQLKEIEEKILKVISAAESNILNDEVLVQTLRDAKSTSGMVQVRVQETEETEKKIDALREVYRPVAVRGSVLYFCAADLSNIASMYQYSLNYFSMIYNKVMEQSAKSANIEKRLATLIANMTKAVFVNVTRGLFKEHKILFSFMICVSILRQQGKITDNEWNLLLRGSIVGNLDGKETPNPDPSWISEEAWKMISSMEKLEPNSFRGIVNDFVNNPEPWKQYWSADEPHTLQLPAPWNEKLTKFQQMLILKSLRLEKVIFVIGDFIAAHLGKEFIDPPPLDLGVAFKETSSTMPLIFILSQGADPTANLVKMAKEKNYDERLHIISLGQGTGPVAANMIERATKAGDWVFLQNCHLAVSWLPTLEKIIGNLPDTEVSEDFRLILSSMPTDHFPVSVLQNGVKVTNERPQGLKANLARSFAEISEATFEDMPSKSLPWKKLLFGLCFFHAEIQERKKYGSLGWNVKYEFNDSDLEVAIELLRLYLQESVSIPWDALKYLTGDIYYGGRVTDEWDRRLLKSVLNNLYTPDILNDNYLLSSSGAYKVPPEGSLTQVRQHVDTFPFLDKPEVFGLHDNADITYQNQETNRFITTLLNIQPRMVSQGAKSNDQNIVLALSNAILGTLPPLLNPEEANESLSIQIVPGVNNSLTTVLFQEIARYNRLLTTIRTTLLELEKAIKGLVVMSESLEKTFNSMVNNQVPKVWKDVSYPSLKPLREWNQDLIQRIAFMKDWLVNGFPKVFWLSGLFFPQGFLTAVLQNQARKYNIPIDSLSFSFSVIETPHNEITESPADGVYIHGLFLEGATWNKEKGVLADPVPGEMYGEFPVLHLLPRANFVPNPEEYACPIYRTHERAGELSTTGHSSNYLLAAYLKTDKRPDYWVLRGTALLSAVPSLK